MQKRHRLVTGARKLLCIAIGTMALAGACTPAPELLNSERIERSFGSFGIEIIRADEGQRISSLYSADAGGRICRTLAIVDFNSPIDSRIASEHAAVVSGQSIGQVFRDSGWKIVKTTLSVGESTAEDYRWKIAVRMRIEPGTPLATHRYRFDVVKGTLRIHYATITEIHHPDYLRMQQLLALRRMP